MRSLVLLVLVPAVAVADPHPMSSGATPAPTTDTKVEMVDEVLTIDMDQSSAAVKAAVTLHDAGAATEMLVGFPCATGDEAGAIDVPCKTPVKVTVRGKAVRVDKKTSGKESHWTWAMKFSAGETVPVVVEYRAPLVNPRYNVPVSGMGLFTYRLTTGARWAGPIKKLTITLNHMQEALIFVSPPGYQREPGRLTWTLTDYEPTEEIIVMPQPGPGLAFAMKIGAKTAAEARAKLLAGDFAKADIERLVDDLHRNDSYIDDWLKTITRLGGVPAPTKERAKAVMAETEKFLVELKKQAKR
jgi:hypothetical protein